MVKEREEWGGGGGGRRSLVGREFFMYFLKRARSRR
jgi:hypothetical protein